MSRAVCLFLACWTAVLEGCLDRFACACCVAWRFVGDVWGGVVEVLEGCLKRFACFCCAAWRVVGDVSSGLRVFRVMLVGLAHTGSR